MTLLRHVMTPLPTDHVTGLLQCPPQGPGACQSPPYIAVVAAAVSIGAQPIERGRYLVSTKANYHGGKGISAGLTDCWSPGPALMPLRWEVSVARSVPLVHFPDRGHWLSIYRASISIASRWETMARNQSTISKLMSLFFSISNPRRSGLYTYATIYIDLGLEK